MRSRLFGLSQQSVNIAIALGLSLLIHPLRERSANFFKGAFYLPGVVSQVVISVIMVWVFSPMSGLANMNLDRIGLPTLMWYGSPNTSLMTLMLINWLTGHGFSILLYTERSSAFLPVIRSGRY